MGVATAVPLATALRDRHRDGILDRLWPAAPEYWRSAVRAAWMEGATCALEGDEDGERAAVERIERLLKHRDFVLAKRARTAAAPADFGMEPGGGAA